MDMLRTRILEAVESLRLRKCRPDRETIAHFVLRKYGAQYTEIFSELENIVDEGHLIKVEYKNTISYRNPSSFDLKSSPLLTKHSKILNSARTTRMILTAVSDFLSNTEEYSRDGIPPEDLHAKLIECDGKRFTTENVQLLIGREVSCGTLQVGGPFKVRIYPKDIVIPPVVKEDVEEVVPKKRGRKKVAPGEKDNASEQEGEKEKAGENEKEKPTNDSSPMVAAIRNVVAEKVAAAVRKTYEGIAGANKMKIGQKKGQGKQLKPPRVVAVAKEEEVLKSPVKRNLAHKKNIKVTGKPRGKGKAVEEPPVTPEKGKNNKAAPVSVPAESSPEKAKEKDSPVKATVVERTTKSTTPKSEPVKTRKSKEAAEALMAKAVEEEPKGRSSQRDKRKRKVFDPSDLDDPSPPQPPPKKKTPQKKKKSDNSSLCEYCQRHKNSQGEDEEFLVCQNCDATMHPSCMDYNEKLATRLRMNNWLCFDCKICDICHVNTNSGGDGELLCESCDKSYHVKCLKLPEKPKERWVCEECFQEDRKSKKARGNDATVKQNDVIESEIPDASTWTPKEVEEYFIMKGLPDEANVFKEQEIDGLSLLLMRRADVIFGLKLRLGPALKLYKLIYELQTKTPRTKSQ